MLSTIIVHLSCIFSHDATAKVACLIAPATSSACFPQSNVSAFPFLPDRTSSFCFFFLPICQIDVSLKRGLLGPAQRQAGWRTSWYCIFLIG